MSEDPFYCGETLKQSKEVPCEKIWRFRTEKEMIDRHGDDWMNRIERKGISRKRPNGSEYHWVTSMTYLLGKPASEVAFSDYDLDAPDSGGMTTQNIVEFNIIDHHAIIRVVRVSGQGTWVVNPSADMIHAPQFESKLLRWKIYFIAATETFPKPKKSKSRRSFLGARKFGESRHDKNSLKLWG